MPVLPRSTAITDTGAIHGLAGPDSTRRHVNDTFAVSIHTLANATIDITPYQSHVRRTHSHARGDHDRYHPISIACPPHPFTHSRSPRLISPHINRPFAAPNHRLAKATIDITPYQSHVRRLHSQAHRVHHRYHPISIARPPHPFTHSQSPRSISPHIDRAFAASPRSRLISFRSIRIHLGSNGGSPCPVMIGRALLLQP
jgi:hypothetical protein